MPKLMASLSLLRRSMSAQENHEARFPAPSMSKRCSLAHTALGTGTPVRYGVRGAGCAARSIRHQELYHEMGNPGCGRDPFWLRNHDVRGQSVRPNSCTAGGGVD